MLSCLRSPDQWAVALRRHTAIASVSNLNGACQITHGRYFWPLEPSHPANDYDIEFIAHILAGDRRWAGVTSDANGDPSDYSVAQHSVIVSEIVERSFRDLVPKWDWSLSLNPSFYGLMHDSQEAYLRDMVRPVKPFLGTYKEIETALQSRILNEFDVPVDAAIREAVRRVDDMMIFLERDELVGKPCVPYSNEADHPRITIHDVVKDFEVWDAKTSKRKFLERFEHCFSVSRTAA